MTKFRKYDPCSRLPCNRPCMSVNAMTTVSISPELMDCLRCSRSRSRGLRRGSEGSGMGSPIVSGSGEQAGQETAEQRSRVVAVTLHHASGLARLILQDGLKDAAVLPVGVLDVDLEHRDGAEHVVQVRLHGRHGADDQG